MKVKLLEKVLIYLAESQPQTTAKSIEYSVIKRYHNRVEWQKLSSSEKQAKRKSILRSVKKYMEEDGIATFTYENAVVEFYDIGLKLEEKLTEEIISKEELLLRLSILIRIDMDSIDTDSTLHDKKIIPLLVYDNLQKELLKANCCPEEMIRLIKCVKILNPVMEISES